MSYNLGAVKPWVASAADEIGGKFHVGTVYGFAQRDYKSDHPLGLALDFMVYGDKAKGDEIAAYVKDNASELAVTYVIWYQHIWSVERAGEGWRAMDNRGSLTANHMDHVHVSFTADGKGTKGGTQNAGISIPNPLDAATSIAANVKAIMDVFTSWAKVAAFLTNPSTPVRLGTFFLGVGLVALALVMILSDKNTGLVDTAKKTANAVGKVTKDAT